MHSLGASTRFLHFSAFFSCCLVTNASFSPPWRVSELNKSKLALLTLPSPPWTSTAQEDPPGFTEPGPDDVFWTEGY